VLETATLIVAATLMSAITHPAVNVGCCANISLAGGPCQFDSCSAVHVDMLHHGCQSVQQYEGEPGCVGSLQASSHY